MDKFIELMAEVFEIETDKISADSRFREDLGEFSSLMGYAILVLIEDEYNYKMSVEEFLKCDTVQDLYDSINK